MPQRNKNSKSVLVTGSDLHETTIANATSSVVVNIDCSLSTRLTNAAKAFEFYRFESLLIELLPHSYVAAPTTSSDQVLAAGYIPEATGATTTTISANDVMELQASTVIMANGAGTTNMAVGHTVSKMLRVPKKVLLSTPTKMWRTQAAITEDPEVTQGTLVFGRVSNAGASTHVVPWIVRFAVRFFGQEPTATITRLLRQKPVVAAADEEKEEPDGLSDEDSAVMLVPPKLVRAPTSKIQKRP